MSACKCPQRDLPPKRRAWVVNQRNCNHSAFNGYRATWSFYSSITCVACNANWRTDAAYVTELKDAPVMARTQP